MKHTSPAWIGALVLAATTVSSVLAQQQMGMGGCPMMAAGNLAAHVEGRLAYLRVELGITEAQAAVWKEYEEVVRRWMSGMQPMRHEMMNAMQSGTALDRVKARTTMMETMIASMKAVTPALDGLYKALSDEQKKKADLLLGMGMM
jgi:hypothetical protein